MKNILITGGLGFIGSNFIEYFYKKYQNYRIINLDAITYAADKDCLTHLYEGNSNSRYRSVIGNISDRTLVEDIFNYYDITDVIHFAAESHVDNSIKTPEVFINTNVIGTFTLLDVAYKVWEFKNMLSKSRFHDISTDEVYGTLGETGLFTENTPYAPNSPYSASKASSDMIVRSYHHTYGMNTIITNCSNNYGPRQHDEKLIPTIIRKAISNEKIPIYGDGTNVRDWLYVNDHVKAIDLSFHNGKNGETYNIGGNNERNNNYIANKICEILDNLYPKSSGSYKDQISYVEDRLGHDKRYAIDATKIKNELGWIADENFESGIVKTIEWYLKKYNISIN
jgi:dTDP-glucose 4,6-dehydratase